MSRRDSELDRLRSGRTELENHYIDELVSGSLSRRDFMRRGAVIGMSAPLLGAILAACGGANKSASATSSGTGTRARGGTPKKGGTLKVATQAPSAAVNPLTVADSGGLAMLNQTGEFLAFDSNLKLMLQPMLALSWKPNSDGSVWTFNLRPGVTFHNGQAMTADDVVYSCQQCSDPKNASSALSAIGGVLAAERRQEGRFDDGRLPPRGAQRQLPLPRLVRHLQRDHRTQGHRLQQVAEHVPRHRRVQAQELHPERRRRVRRRTRPTGAAAPTWTEPTSPSTRVSRRRSSPSRAARSTSSRSSSCRGRRDCSTTRASRSSR